MTHAENANPKVSVIMPVYNREHYLIDAIESITRQTFDDFEFIIVDDYSTDRSFFIAEQYAKQDSRIHLFHNKYKKGIVGSLQTAIDTCRGEFIARMDSDDISLPQRLENQVKYLNQNSDISACGSWVRLIGANEGVIWELPTEPEVIKATMLFCGAIANPSVMIRRDVFFEKGYSYDDEFKVAEDYDFWTRITKTEKISNIAEILLEYRTHDSNTKALYPEEHFSAPRKVILRELDGLGLNPSDKELNFHEKIGRGEPVFSEKTKAQVNLWFEKIIDSNKKKKIFSENALFSIIEERKRICFKELPELKKELTLQFLIVKIGRILKKILPEKVVDNLYFFLLKIYHLLNLIYRSILNKTEKIRVFMGFGFKLKKNVNENFKIGMAVLAHERPEYLELCLESLFKTKLYNYDITFLINDDGSLDPKVKDIINKQRDVKYRVIRNFTSKGPNCAGAAINKAVRKLLEIDDFDIIGWCDSDALFHPEWLDQTMKVCLWAKENHRYHVLGPFSSFNSSDYKFHVILGNYSSPYGEYVVKRQMGMLNYFYFKEDFLKLGYFPENKDDETLMTKSFEKLGVRNFCTKTSYVEHLGQESVLNQWRPTKIVRAVHGMHLAQGDWGFDMEKLSPYGYYKYLKKDNVFGDIDQSLIDVDVIIPVIKKDLDVLPYVVKSIRKYLKHPIDKIYIVAPDDEEIRNFCDRNDCVFKFEDSVLPIKLEEIKYKVFNKNRSGWIFQQLIKLNADRISSKKHVYILDADTILVQSQKFEKDRKGILLVSDEFHVPYHHAYEKIFKYKTTAKFSFVSHQIFMDTSLLGELKCDIENKNNGKPWYSVILDNLDDKEMSSFSEYETYGNWVTQNHPESILMEYWHNHSISKSMLVLFRLGLIGKNVFKKYRSISFHSYSGILSKIKTFFN